MTAGSPPPRPPRRGPGGSAQGGPERLRDPRRRPGAPAGRPAARAAARSAHQNPPRPGYVKAPPRPRAPRRVIPRANPVRRLGITLLAIAFLLTLFAARLVQMQGFDAGTYRTLASQQRDKTIELPALRGSITGANGEVLAMTVATYLVYADPPEIPAAQQPAVAARLSTDLGMPAAQILTLIQHPSSPQYVVLAKGVSAQDGNAIQAENLPGISLTASYARSYPDGDSTADVLGFTGTSATGDLTGAAGIEQEYNSLLAGKSGSQQVQIGTNGQQIPLAGNDSQPVVNGSDLRLTIMPALQYDAQQACATEVAKSKAANCTVVIIQPKTGYVLAMAQWPTFNPSTVTSVNQATDLAVQNEFQPGSTAKVMAAAAAFEHGGQTPLSAYTIPYQIEKGGQLIHDAEWAPGEKYTIAGIIANSSNIGISQVAAHITPQVQYGYLRAFGLGQPSGLGLPGETAGDLPPVSQWYPDTRYTLAFGQGVATTAIQMAERVRDDRQRRRAGAADAGRGHNRLRRQVHPGRSLAATAGDPAENRAGTAGHPGAGPGRRRSRRPALGHHPRLCDRGQDRNFAGIQRKLRAVRLRGKLHWHGARQRPAAGDRGQCAEPEEGRPLR